MTKKLYRGGYDGLSLVTISKLLGLTISKTRRRLKKLEKEVETIKLEDIGRLIKEYGREEAMEQARNQSAIDRAINFLQL